MNIPLNIDFLQILLHMLNFVILAGGLSFLLYKPVIKFIEQRKEYFSQVEENNQKVANENERLRQEYTQKLKDAQSEIDERKKELEKEQAEASALYISKAKEKAAAIILAAEQDAEYRKAQILESAQNEIGEIVVNATQRLLSDTVTPERNSALYDEFIRLAGDTVTDERSKYDKK